MRRPFKPFAALVLLLALVAPVRAVFDSWSDLPAFPTQTNLWSVAYGDRTLIAVGEQGTVGSFSYDDRVWKLENAGTTDWLVGVGFGAGRFVIVGDRGTILTSDDLGRTWTRRASGIATRLNAVAHGNGLWFAVGEQDVVLSSPDGTTWTLRPPLGDGTQFLRALAFGRGRFLLGGARGLLATTTDGVTFARVPLDTGADIEGAAITESRFFVVGSQGLRAHAAQLDAWFVDPRSELTYRGIAARNLEEVSTVGNAVSLTGILSGGQLQWTRGCPA